ncbi:MAG: hypothetical protein ACYCZF_13335 [Anaerolineae bacterium]
MDLTHNNFISLTNIFGVSLTIDTSGTYEVLYQGRNWLGKGLVSVLYQKAWHRNLISTHKPCDDVFITNTAREDNLSDEIGTYTLINLTWQLKDGGLSFHTSCKFYYDVGCILFEVEYPAEPAYIVFPQFACGGPDIRRDLHAWVPGFMGQYAVRHNTNAADGFVDPNRPNTAIPLVLFDSDYDTLILSPFSNYLVSHQYTEKVGGGQGYGFSPDKLISCGLNQHFAIPPGFKHSTMLYFGSGISRTTSEYGDLVLQRAGKARPSKYQDNTISYLSYWVDYGSYYWHEIFSKQNKLNYEDIMICLAREAEENGLVIKSWEVQDGDQNRWQEGIFDARADVMPHGLAYLREKIGQPLYAYFSPLEPGPYRSQYPYVFTGHVTYGDIGSIGMGDLFYTEEFWDDQVKKLKGWGSEGLQHDFLSDYWNTPAAVDTIDRYMKSMAKACVKYKVSMQYCMCYSNHVLETAENKAVVSLQAIGDHHPCAKDGGCGKALRSFIYSSLLYGALGIWPARDNIQSMADPDGYEDILVANLSGGPIQLGHALGQANLDLLGKTFREGDGLLLKPDKPLVPLDRCFLQDDPLVAYTETHHQVGTWKYVLALNIANEGWPGGYFTPGECGCDAKEYVLYDFHSQSASRIGRDERHICPDGVKHSYYILAPIFANGLVLIGDIRKFVTMADQRITDVVFNTHTLSFTVLAGGKSNVVVAGWAANKPSRITAGGNDLPEGNHNSWSALQVNTWCWNENTNMWHIHIRFSSKEIAAKAITVEGTS